MEMMPGYRLRENSSPGLPADSLFLPVIVSGTSLTAETFNDASKANL